MKAAPAFAATLLLLSACAKRAQDIFPGYAEGDRVRLSAPLSGTLTRVFVRQGDSVRASAPAFVLEQVSERAGREEAASRVRQAQDQLANLQQGRRPEELEALRAQLSQAQAAFKLSSANLARASKLVAENFNSPATLDEARAAVARDQGSADEIAARLRLAMQGGRKNEIAAAAQEVNAAKAQLEQAEWRLQQKTQRIPVAGDVVEVLYREGEWVPQGSPVLTLLPPANIKARFFLPQPQLGKITLGQRVQLHCDGCAAPIPAKVSFVAREAEFTAPLIYSKESRASLVFMVEALPSAEDARKLHPGQPLEVRL